MTQPIAMSPVPSRKTDGSGVAVFGARSPARSESADTGSGTRPRFIEGAAPGLALSGAGLFDALRARSVAAFSASVAERAASVLLASSSRTAANSMHPVQ